jgi:hypothetical protein
MEVRLNPNVSAPFCRLPGALERGTDAEASGGSSAYKKGSSQ